MAQNGHSTNENYGWARVPVLPATGNVHTSAFRSSTDVAVELGVGRKEGIRGIKAEQQML